MVIALYVREAPNMCVMRILRMRDGNLRRGSSMLKAGICGVDVIYTPPRGRISTRLVLVLIWFFLDMF